MLLSYFTNVSSVVEIWGYRIGEPIVIRLPHYESKGLEIEFILGVAYNEWKTEADDRPVSMRPFNDFVFSIIKNLKDYKPCFERINT